LPHTCIDSATVAALLVEKVANKPTQIRLCSIPVAGIEAIPFHRFRFAGALADIDLSEDIDLSKDAITLPLYLINAEE
jgi:hypothetical protein